VNCNLVIEKNFTKLIYIILSPRIFSSAIRPKHLGSWISKEFYYWWYNVVFRTIGIPQV